MKTRSNAGFSLIETLLAAAMVGGLIAVAAGIYAHVHDEANLGEAVRETEELRNYAQGIFDQPNLCGLVFAGMRWNFNASSANNLKYANYSITSLVVGTNPLNVGNLYSRGIKVADFRVREPFDTEGGPARSKVTLTNITGSPVYTLVPVKFVITTQSKSVFKPMVLTRNADALLAFDSSNTFQFCVNSRHTAGDGTDIQCGPLSPGLDMSACRQDFYCPNIYFVNGFNNDGSPRCKCMSSCISGPQGAVGHAPPKTSKSSPSSGGSGGSGSGGGGGNGGGGGGGP